MFFFLGQKPEHSDCRYFSLAYWSNSFQLTMEYETTSIKNIQLPVTENNLNVV